MIVSLFRYLLQKRAQRLVRRNATIACTKSTLIGSTARVILMDEATKSQVLIGDRCWLKGKIICQGDGVVKLHDNVQIGINAQILCVNRVEIGAYTVVASDATICDNNNHPVNPVRRKEVLSSRKESLRWANSASAPIVIGENCWIGANVRICKGVTIGDNSIVGACAVVTKDVPANCIVAGNPAKIVRTNIDKVDW